MGSGLKVSQLQINNSIILHNKTTFNSTAIAWVNKLHDFGFGFWFWFRVWGVPRRLPGEDLWSAAQRVLGGTPDRTGLSTLQGYLAQKKWPLLQGPPYEPRDSLALGS